MATLYLILFSLSLGFFRTKVYSKGSPAKPEWPAKPQSRAEWPEVLWLPRDFENPRKFPKIDLKL